MRSPARSLFRGGLLALGVGFGLACNAITGLNHYEIDPSLADAGSGGSGNADAGAPCTTILDCPGVDDICQKRACNENQCQTVLVAEGTLVPSQTLGDCHRIECDGIGSPRDVIDTNDVPNDGLECTTDECSPEGMPSNSFRQAGVKCTQNDGAFCNGAGACVACSFSTDCPGNGPCQDGKCVSPQCVDGNTNGNETDIDCGGGDCGPCQDLHSCLANADCISKVCIAKKCEPATCNDTTKNGDETDVDCGGPTCSDCLDGKGCLVAPDCTSGVCTNNICQTPKCDDGVKNGAETDLDCGGTCGGCDPGQTCNLAADCKSEACLAGKCAGIVQIAAGTSHACALLNDGTAYCWGNNTNGELGDTTLLDKAAPQKVQSLTGATQISLGINASETQGSHSCARRMDGTAVCWGRNASGQLGVGSSVAATVPTQVKTITGVAQIVAGGRHTCARMTSGAVSCWGGNGQGQVGNGTTTGVSSPVAIAGIVASSLALGDAHSCALLTTGTMSCWGDGTLGEIGNGAILDKAVPTAVPGFTNILQIAAGKDFMLARTGAGQVYSWGENSDGQLGLGNTTMQTTPKEITGLVGVVSLAGGTDGVSTDADGANGGHSCVVFQDGTLQCFGHGLRGQLGTGGITNQSTPQPVMIPPVAEVSLGLQFSCARLVTGAIRCWGRNDKGQLGTGAPGPDQTTPVPVVFQ